MLQALRESNPLFFYLLPMGGVALAAVGLLFDSVRCSRWLRLAPLLVLPLLALAVDEFQLDLQPGCGLALQVLTALCGIYYLMRAPLVSRGLALAWAGAQNARLQWCTLLAMSLLSGVVWVYREDPTLFAENDFTDLMGANPDPSAFQTVDSVRAYTDRGRPITLFTAPAMDWTREKTAKIEKLVCDAAREHAIRLAPADVSYNCHGWTFVEGKYWIKGGEVEAILQDNGYQTVSKPQVNDLVVFRDGSHVISHTGVVRTVLPDGEILIESKWGWAGRFVHTAGGHIYGNALTIYRSERHGHRLHISTDAPEPVPAGVF